MSRKVSLNEALATVRVFGHIKWFSEIRNVVKDDKHLRYWSCAIINNNNAKESEEWSKLTKDWVFVRQLSYLVRTEKLYDDFLLYWGFEHSKVLSHHQHKYEHVATLQCIRDEIRVMESVVTFNVTWIFLSALKVNTSQRNTV